MIIHLSFNYNREILSFLIKNREVYYTDRKWKAWIRCLPPPENFIQKIKMSRNKIPKHLAELFNFSEEELEEYEAAKDEEALATIIIKDALFKGCRLLKKEVKNNVNLISSDKK